MQTQFQSFVAIRLTQADPNSTAAKAMRSFLESAAHGYALTPEAMLADWVAVMIDRGLSDSSRTRYLGTLSNIYKEYLAQSGAAKVDSLIHLRNIRTNPEAVEEATRMAVRLRKVFGMVINDARYQPEIAVLLYMLLNVSNDLKAAISLQTCDYEPQFPQMDSVIDPDTFHHRRRYVFDLAQSRKRMSQLCRETLTDT
ncbi:MAG: hypothetical protein HDR88_05385 [Bacteroides sp.]|nr:hypothetical protein [Bacteroides sp.]